MSQITEADKQLFRQSLSGVRPLPPNPRVNHTASTQHALKRRLRYQQYTLEPTHPHTVADEHNVPLIQAQTVLHFQRHPLTAKQQRTLQQGQFATRCVIDLHGKTEQQAEEIMQRTLQRCRYRHDRYLLIVHGKGLSSANNYPILKNWLNWWLRHQPRVLAFCSAQASDGGTGALYVLISPPSNQHT